MVHYPRTSPDAQWPSNDTLAQTPAQTKNSSAPADTGGGPVVGACVLRCSATSAANVYAYSTHLPSATPAT